MLSNIEQQSRNSYWKNFVDRFFNDDQISSRKKLYNTLWAILFGFIISGLLISFSGNNPFAVFASMFSDGWGAFGNKFITVFVAYVFASLAVGICFKAGLFNIGISGQMMAGGFTTLVIFRSELLTKTQISGGSIFLAIIIAILVGAFIASIAGSLKVFLGINEVVTTIILNWIVFFVIKFFIYDLQTWGTFSTPFLADANSISSNLSINYTLPNFFYPTDLSNSWYSNAWNWIIISFAIVAVVTVWLIMKRTRIGYKIKMIGFNKDASAYSGTNQKSLTLIIMVLSGALAGFAGFIWYFGQGGQIDVSTQPLVSGFDAIAISLLVYNNPIGIFFSSILYGMLSVGCQGLPTEFVGLPKETSQLIIGIIIYIAAITIVFSKLNLYEWVKKFIVLSRYKEYRSARVDYLKSKFEFIKLWFKSRQQIISIWSQNHLEWRNFKKELNANKDQLEQNLMNKYNMKIFKLEHISEDEQLNYFEQLSKFRKEIDFKLAKSHYFEKNNIKSSVNDYLKQAQHKYEVIKFRCINDYYEKKGVK